MRDPEGCIARGLRIDEHFEGRRLFSLKADRLKVSGKKAGFLRLGFWKVAKFENLSIDFYSKPCGTEIQDSNGRVIDGAEFSDLGDFFMRNDKLKRMMPKGVKGVEISNISINQYREGRIVSSLRSDQAKVDFRGKELVFKGNVKMACGNGKTLQCGKMSWLAEAKKFKTSEPYVLKTRHQTLRGKGLQTDYRLENMVLQDFPWVIQHIVWPWMSVSEMPFYDGGRA